MNQKESTAIDINHLLATNQVDIRGQNHNRENRISVLEHLKQRIQNGEEILKIPDNRKAEENIKLIFRFNDFRLNAQLKFCKLLKNDSSIWTINKSQERAGTNFISETQISETLKILNPIIASNYYDGFCMGSFNRRVEKKLSHLIYHASRPFRITEQENYLIRRSIDRY